MSSQSRLPSIRRTGSAAAAIPNKTRPLSMFEVSAEQLKNFRSIGESATSLLQSDKDRSSSESGSNVSGKQSRRRSLLPQFSSRKGSNDTSKDTTTAVTIKEDESEIMAEVMAQEEPRDTAKAVLLPPARPVMAQESQLPSKGDMSSDTYAHARNTSGDSNKSSGQLSTATSQPSSVSLSPSRSSGGQARTDFSRLPSSAIRSTNIQNKTARARTASNVSIAAGAHNRTASTMSITTVTGGKRPSVTGVRPNTAISTTQVQSSSRQVSPPRPISSRSNAKSQLPPPSKPFFSTYQQHYSPAKSVLPKPPVPTNKISTAAGMAPSSAPESDVLPSIDILKDQTDLLHLSILHQESCEMLSLYQSSAKSKLSQRHAELVQTYQSISALEREQRRLTNLSSIERWCPEPMALAEHLQTLAHALIEIRSLTDPGSRYDELTSAFEAWMIKAERVPGMVWPSQPSQSTTHFFDVLPESWKTTHTSLALKLRAVQHDIGLFAPIPAEADLEGPSSLQFLLSTFRKLVDGMLRELDIMMKVQKEVTMRGKARLVDQVEALLHSTDGTLRKESWNPAWRLVQVQ